MNRSFFIGIVLMMPQLAQALTVTSLNIQWFGRGGAMEGLFEDEYRSTRLRQFLNNQMPASDIFVFQEITQTKQISDTLPEYRCETYEVPTERHQFVVICAKQEMRFETSVNYDVQLGQQGLRAAMIATFQFEETGKLTVIGLHLKAGPDATSTRLEQVRALESSLDRFDHRVIVIGDFNTYPKSRTGRLRDDDQFMDAIFSPKGFSQVPIQVPTYVGFRGNTLDRVWVRDVLIKRHAVYGPCVEDSVQFPFSRSGFFRRFVSDHCAVQIEF